ncbi:zinc-ribbon domain-containing protein [Sporolactobacillus sp. THM19-2]|uniref:zinc ribbon domain-containing protein n=1 Tax=Sporolactobacillus sp. THM19-2 TaxID=2511171 RepID=UPI0013EB7E35|nr:zinc-ribbon domain-containing protein [Sporolactobacillus sp. THM19-2]
MYCKHCGAPLHDGAKFCGTCGAPVPPADGKEQGNDRETEPPVSSALHEDAPDASAEKVHEDQHASEHEERQMVAVPPRDAAVESADTVTERQPATGKSWIHRKAIMIPLVSLIIILAGLYFMGKYLTDPVRTVDAFEQAVEDQNIDKLKGMIYTYEDVKMTDTQVKAMLAWFKNDPDTYSDIVQSLENTAHAANHVRYGHTPYYLHKAGKQYLLFDHYQIATELIYPEVTTNLKNMVIGITGAGKGKTAEKAESNSPQTIKLDGVIPGIYTFYGHSDAMDQTKKKTLTSDDRQVDFSGTYISLSSNIPVAELYVNNKDTGKTVAQSGEWGPFKKDDTPTFYARYTANGHSIQSETVSVSDESDYDTVTLDEAESDGIDLYFEDVENGDFYTLDGTDNQANMETLKTYFDDYYNANASAVSYGEMDHFASFFETGTDFSNSQLKSAQKFYDNGVTESINSYDLDNLKSQGKGLYSVEANESWDETITDDETGDRKDITFTLKNTYQLKETAPGELKIVGMKIEDRKVQTTSESEAY